MDLKEFDKLEKKIKVKDFESNNKSLDKWLYRSSFIGNVGSIFFAYFLVYPSLFKAISINLINGLWATILSFIFSVLFLTIFEVIKRILIKNFSSDYVANNKKISPTIFGWFIISVSIVLLSFYLSLVGSKDLATIKIFKDNIAEVKMDVQIDSISKIYEDKKKTYVDDNISLRTINNNLRDKLTQTPIEYRVVRNDYQSSIDKNTKIIDKNQAESDKIDEQLKQRIENLKLNFINIKSDNNNENNKNVILFIIIAFCSELLIIFGIYNRENFEQKLYNINKDKFKKILQKKERYKTLLSFIYNKGKLNVGDKVIGGLELKKLISERTTIPNKFVDEFFREAEKLGIFSVVGKRRFIAITYTEAVSCIENYDDIYLVLENIK